MKLKALWNNAKTFSDEYAGKLKTIATPFTHMYPIKSWARLVYKSSQSPKYDGSLFCPMTVQWVLHIQVLKELEGVAPTKEDYSQLCLLLTLNKLSEHPDYRSWNPVKARYTSSAIEIQIQIANICHINTNTNTRCNCFKQILPLVRELLAGERRSPAPGPGLVAANDRLLQLIIKVGFQRIFFKVLRLRLLCK